MREHLSELVILTLGVVLGVAMVASPIIRWVYGG